MAGIAVGGTGGTGGAGLGSRLARLALISTGALFITSGVIDGTFLPLAPELLAAFLIAFAGAIALTGPGRSALDARRAVFVACCSPLSGTLILAAVGVPGEIWMFSFSSYLSALLITRGNLRAGFASGAALLAVGIATGILTPAPPPSVVALVGVPVMALVTGVVWNLLLRHLVARELAYRADAAESALAADLARETAQSNTRELREIGDLASPLLRRIADGTTPDEPLHRELTVVEAAIRDRIRSPGFQHPALIEAITAFRYRGGRLLLLGARAEPVSTSMADALAEIISKVPGGEVTIRELPKGRDGAATIRIACASSVELITLATDGLILERR